MEVVLAEHPAVAEVAVVGTPDGIQGEVAVAFVALRAGAAATDAELRRFCRERLPPHKVPAHIEVIDAIPRSGAGKPLKSELAAPARAVRAARGLP
jgi:acyl-coenzyme A synthetase/AMP-(fatty) acid ligase